MRILLSAALAMLLTFSAAAQSMLKISGTVLDESSEPAVGVSVVVKGTTTGAVTDVNGGYDIQAPADGVLRFSFVGMADVEEPINGRGRIDVTLANAANNLDEVVVIGYGTVRKRDLTGAVSSVGGKDVAAVPVSSAAEAITGKMAGVQVTTTEGSPDAEVKIRVRGGGSITQSSNPLYIVDGFPVSSINDIAPGDIQSMDVLKDASSAAIYGARGANGVVIITTKSGQEGKLTVNYNAYYGWKKIAKTLDVISPYDYALWSYERSLLADDDKYARYFGNWEDIDMYDGIAFNDWQDIIFGNVGTTFNHNLSISGGTEKSKYAFSYNHIDDEAIAKGSNYARDNLALKLTSNPHKRVQLDFSVRWAKTGVNGPITNDGGEEKGSTSDTRLKSVMIYPSIPLTAKELTDPSETDPDFALYSPTVSLRDNERVNNRKTLNMGGAASWEFIDGFKLKTEVGLDQYDERNDRFYGVTTYYSRMTVPGNDNKGKPAVIFTDRNRETLRNTNTLNMDFNTFLPKDHSLSLLLGQEYLITTSHTMESLGAGFDYSFNLDMARRLTTEGNGGEYYPAVNNSFSPDDKLFSWFGRTNYSYQGKYLASATFRADGSSKFASGNRWGLFPSVSAAWRISAEPFMEGTNKWLNDLKLRASYGTAGNNNIPAGQMTQTYQASGTSWVGGYSSYWAPSKIMANPDLTWETTITRNVGVDWSLLNGSLSGTVEAYLNSTKDLLLLFPTPGTGYDNQYRNMGETENQGLEISANWAAVSKKNFTVSVSANIGFNKNKVVSLGDMEEVTGATEWSSTEVGTDYMVRIGQPIGQMYGYRAAGRYEVSDFDYVDGKWRLKDGVVNCSDVIGANQLRPGAMKLEDIDGDHKVTSDNDRVVIGNANPLHTGGFSVNVRAYGFDLGAYFNWSYGNDVYNANKIEYTSTSKFHSRNMIDIMADGSRWTNLDKTTGQLITDPAALEAANANTTMWSPWMSKYVLTDWAVEDGSFLRLNTLTLGYTLPRSLTERVKLSATRFYVSAYNVFCLTGYSGFDPEVDTRRKVPYTPGVDYAAYPRSRQVVVGLNLTF